MKTRLFKVVLTGISSVFLVILMTSSFIGNAPNTPPHSQDYLIMSVLYHQKAAEYRALCYQAYNLATLRLSQSLSRDPHPKPPAVVVDIDETVLDNSPYEAKLILTDNTYPTYWKDWCELATAKALPGALEFLKFADSAGVAIYYVSNRSVELVEATMRNLKNLGFPQADISHLLLKKQDSSKEGRRQAISQNHEIVLLIGDNLNDFASVFERKGISERFAEVDKLKTAFGQKFIVLPNAMYGEWEGALYNFNWSLPVEERESLRRAALRAF